MYFLLTFCLPLFSAFTTIIALPLAQSDFSLFSSDSPGSSFTSSQANGDFELANVLYPNNNNNIYEQPTTALLVAGKKGDCQSSSVDVQVIGKRQTDSACPAQFNGSPGQGIPDPKSTSPRLETVPNPEPLLPPLTLENPDEDKCPVELMGMSRIPVCDSGRSWQDMMRIPGVKYYTLFNIHLNDLSSPCVGRELPFCCAHTGTQEHPLFKGAGLVPTGYVCKNREIEIFFRKYPSRIPTDEDPGHPLELPPFSP